VIRSKLTFAAALLLAASLVAFLFLDKSAPKESKEIILERKAIVSSSGFLLDVGVGDDLRADLKPITYEFRVSIPSKVKHVILKKQSKSSLAGNCPIFNPLIFIQSEGGKGWDKIMQNYPQNIVSQGNSMLLRIPVFFTPLGESSFVESECVSMRYVVEFEFVYR